MKVIEDCTLIRATAMTTTFPTVTTAVSTIDADTSYAEYLMSISYSVNAFYRPPVTANFMGTSTSWSLGRPTLLPATWATAKYMPYSGYHINSGTTVAEPMGTLYIERGMKMTTYRLHIKPVEALRNSLKNLKFTVAA